MEGIPSGPHADVRTLQRRSRWAVAALVLVIVVDLVAIASDIAEYRLLGTDFSDEEADASDTRQAAVGAIQVLLFLATAVVFIRWFVRAYDNVDPRDRRYGRGWAIGSWFVPILNLWRPKQIANDILAASEGGGFALLNAWWAAFLTSNFVSQLAGRLSLNADTLEELRRSSVAYVVADAIDVVAALLAIAVVRMITARQERQAATSAD